MFQAFQESGMSKSDLSLYAILACILKGMARTFDPI
jgi:hypothetical protein